MKTLILILFFPALLLGQLLAQVPNGVVAELMEFKSSTQETLPAGYAEAFTAAVARSAAISMDKFWEASLVRPSPCDAREAHCRT